MAQGSSDHAVGASWQMYMRILVQQVGLHGDNGHLNQWVLLNAYLGPQTGVSPCHPGDPGTKGGTLRPASGHHMWDLTPYLPATLSLPDKRAARRGDVAQLGSGLWGSCPRRPAEPQLLTPYLSTWASAPAGSPGTALLPLRMHVLSVLRGHLCEASSSSAFSRASPSC